MCTGAAVHATVTVSVVDDVYAIACAATARATPRVAVPTWKWALRFWFLPALVSVVVATETFAPILKAKKLETGAHYATGLWILRVTK